MKAYRSKRAKSVIEGCYLEHRPSSVKPMFHFDDDGRCKVWLVDYAILPLETLLDTKTRSRIVRQLRKERALVTAREETGS